MNINKRQVVVFMLGLVLGAAAIAAAWLALGHKARVQLPERLSASGVSAGMPSAMQAFQPLSTCPLQPATAAVGDKDGHFPLQPDLSGLTATEIASFLVVGREAALSGRLRDAEIAFLMSCRVAEKFKGAASVDAAYAKYLLGEHYAKGAGNASSAAGANRTELLWRAQLLYSDSLNAYVAQSGKDQGTSQAAALGLASVRQALVQTQAQMQLQASTSPAVRDKPARQTIPGSSEPDGPAVRSQTQSFRSPVSAPQPLKNALSKEISPSPPSRSVTPRLSGPSFNCAKAHSVSEKMICSDAELAQLDRELGKIYMRAKNATPDRAGFRRRQEQEWLRRESTCQDRMCLLSWYSERREQLISDIEGSALSGPAASRQKTL